MADTVVNQALGQALRKLRTGRGWTQADLAQYAGMDRSFVSLIELGRNSPSVGMLVRLCQALGVPTAEVIGDMERRVAAMEKGKP
jgi:transcriptional regulator with XRE-family HTH domain